MAHQKKSQIQKVLDDATRTIGRMVKGMKKATEYIDQTRALIEAVHVMVNDVERASACRCEPCPLQGTCSTCMVWQAHDAYEKWILATDTGVDSPPAEG